MIDWAARQFGEIAGLAILLGKYNQQVGNGGHIQYFENGYADGYGGCFSDHDEVCPLHQKMVAWLQESRLSQTELGARVYAITIAFSIKKGAGECEDCEGNGTVSDGGESESTCSRCGGSGESLHEDIINLDQLDHLDNRYFKVNQAWMEALDAYSG